jgi:hypothetical protein
MLDVFDMLWPFDDLSRIITPSLAILFALCVSEIKYVYIVSSSEKRNKWYYVINISIYYSSKA